MENLPRFNYCNINYKKDYKIIKNNEMGSIAIMIIGEVRNFFDTDVYSSFVQFITKIKSEFNNVVIFFLLSEKSTRLLWHYNIYLKDNVHISFEDYLNKYKKYETDENNFRKKIENLDCKYEIYFRNDNENNYINTKYNSNIHYIQNYFIKKCLDLVKIYEEKNNFNFDYVFKSRPDILHMVNSCDLLLKYKNEFDFIFNCDFYFFCSRQISKILEEHIEQLVYNDFNNILDNINTKQPMSSEQLRHLALHFLLILILKPFDLKYIYVGDIGHLKIINI